MNFKFNVEETLGMVVRYYKDYEDRKVTAGYTIGKVITIKKHIPVRPTISFYIKEKVVVDGTEEEQRTFISDEDLERIVATVLGDASIAVDGVDIQISASLPYSFLGIKVEGNKKELTEKKI